MDVTGISMIPLQTGADPGTLARDPARLAKEFDALILRMLLGELGASTALGADKSEFGGAAQSVISQLLADQLADKLDLGLGAVLVRAGMGGEQK